MVERLDELLRTSEPGPDFVARMTYLRWPLPPTRAYIHDKAYSADGCTPSTIVSCLDKHLQNALARNHKLLIGACFLLAAIWGDNGAKMIDLFKYSDIRKWPGNPDVSAFVFKNGVYIPKRREITCGDTLIMLGYEERKRRHSENLEKYMENPPHIEGLRILPDEAITSL
jgi:hypothetical protein